MKRSTVNVVAGAVALLALAVGATFALHTERPVAPPAVSTLFQRSFGDVEGRAQPMEQWRGDLLVINFWATWCAPCVEEMPDLQKIQTEYATRGVRIVGLAIDNAAAVRRFRDEQKLEFPLLLAGAAGTEVVRELGNASGALPYTVLLDPNGAVVRSKLGRLGAGELRSWLDARLAAPSAR